MYNPRHAYRQSALNSKCYTQYPDKEEILQEEIPPEEEQSLKKKKKQRLPGEKLLLKLKKETDRNEKKQYHNVDNVDMDSDSDDGNIDVEDLTKSISNILSSF